MTIRKIAIRCYSVQRSVPLISYNNAKVILTNSDKSTFQNLFQLPIGTSQPFDNERLALNGQCLIEYNSVAKTARLSDLGQFMAPINASRYYQNYPNIDSRIGYEKFNWSFFNTLSGLSCVFSYEERLKLSKLENCLQHNIISMSTDESQSYMLHVAEEQKRIANDFAFESCLLEGCFHGTTNEADLYPLLCNSAQLKHHMTLLENKLNETDNTEQRFELSRELTDILMFNNHKEALNFVNAKGPDELLTKNNIIRTHSLLTYGLDSYSSNYHNATEIYPGIRDGREVNVGCKYVPLEHKTDLLRALDLSLRLINSQVDTFSQSLLTTVLFSYMQLFEDGNKRTARVLGHAVNAHSIPVIYRKQDEQEYLDALVLFYERCNLGVFKELFIKNMECSVEEYYTQKV